jgi:hypothetical protein
MTLHSFTHLAAVTRSEGEGFVSLSQSPGAATDLPFIDEHEMLVSASALEVWRTLTKRMSRPQRGRNEAIALLLAAQPRRAAGTPLEKGATLPGFKVTEAVPGRLLELTGQHRFSQYRLVLTLAAQPGGTLVRARTYARFPGLHGFVYRQLVIGSGGHRVVVRRMLRAVRHHAEKRADG